MKKLTLTFTAALLASLLSTGCAPLLIGGAMVGGVTVATDRRTSGTQLEDETIELCVRSLGHERVLFATDGTMEGCVGKILSADLTAAQREDILWRNFQRVLDRRRA